MKPEVINRAGLFTLDFHAGLAGVGALVQTRIGSSSSRGGMWLGSEEVKESEGAGCPHWRIGEEEGQWQ